jgi:hypothetical protein
VDWYPSKPTLPQVTFGIVFFIVLAAVPLYWSLDEADVGNRIVLWIVAGLLLILALWRVATAIRLVREQRTRR